MLSKLRYYSASAAPSANVDLHQLQSMVRAHLQDMVGPVSLQLLNQGTLGVCLRADSESGPYFVKTHRTDEKSRENFHKEADLAIALYGHRIRVEKFDLLLPSGTQTFLLLEWLNSPPQALEPSLVQTITSQYQTKLRDYPIERIARFGTIFDIMSESRRAFNELAQLHLISANTAAIFQSYLSSADQSLKRVPPIICHGDLSNKNIMYSGSEPIIIDWEDAFLGFQGYDFLYWLTFMENRKHLLRSTLVQSALDGDSARGVLAAIVAIKSIISVRLDAHRNNQISIENRLLELVQL